MKKPVEVKIPDVFYKGIKLKKAGEFGQYEEYTTIKVINIKNINGKKEDIMPIN